MSPPCRPESSQKCSSRIYCAYRTETAPPTVEEPHQPERGICNLRLGRIHADGRAGGRRHGPHFDDQALYHRGIEVDDHGKVGRADIGPCDLADRRHVRGYQERLAGAEVEGIAARHHPLGALQHHGDQWPVDRILQLGWRDLPNEGQAGHGRDRDAVPVGMCLRIAAHDIEQRVSHLQRLTPPGRAYQWQAQERARTSACRADVRRLRKEAAAGIGRPHGRAAPGIGVGTGKTFRRTGNTGRSRSSIVPVGTTLTSKRQK